MKKVIFFTKYSPMGASSRLRSFQFFPFLEEKKIIVHHSSLLGDKYLKALYSNKKTKAIHLLFGYLTRLFTLLSVKKYDIVIIEKELFPYLPAWAEIILKKAGIKYFVDYDDAIFHNYDLNSNRLIRKFLSDKIDKVMKNSKCVFAGNSYLAKRAEESLAPEIIILPTVIDSKKYYKINNKSTEHFTLGWIGSPSTYKYIEELFPVFYELKAEFSNFKVNIIGAQQAEEIKDFIHFIPWKEKTEVQEINKFDLGIMPLHETPWELGKCSYKLIQYMGCSVAVLGSKVGANSDVIIPEYNGSFIQDNDWYSAIKKYIVEKEKTVIQGKHGRILIDSTYNIENNLKKILKAFES